MKLTTKGKFAVTALLDIALYSAQPKEPMTLYSISERQGISVSYLEQLFVKLRRSGMVKSYKGPGGGYVLAHELTKIRISDIIRAVDDDMDARSCSGMRNCGRNNQQCITHDLWNDLTAHMYSYLEQITLFDLVKNNSSKVNIIKFNNPVISLD